MSTVENKISDSLLPGGGPFRWLKLAIWVAGSLLLGSGAAKAAVDAQMYFAPLLVFPLLVGIGLAAFLVVQMRVGQVGHRPTILLGTVLAAFVAVGGQHYLDYLAVNRERQQPALPASAEAALRKMDARLPPPPPENFFEFMRQQAAQGRPVFGLFEVRDGGAWILWTIEGMLTLAAALAVVIPAMRLPFCGRCGSWYRATRSARFHGTVIQRFAKVLDVDVPTQIRSGRCRLISCQSGCGPCGCQLSYEDLAGNTYFAQVWLDPATRNAVGEVFDDVLNFKV